MKKNDYLYYDSATRDDLRFSFAAPDDRRQIISKKKRPAGVQRQKSGRIQEASFCGTLSTVYAEECPICSRSWMDVKRQK